MSEETLTEEQVTPSEPTPEDKAREGGWVPKEEWQGNPEEWIAASEFNFRGELMDRIKSQNKQIKKQDRELTQVKQSYVQWQEHATKVAKQEFEDKLKQLKQVKKEALESNDAALVVEADEKISDLKESQKVQPTTQSTQYSPEVEEWLGDNEWYTQDSVMRGAADALADDVRKEMPEATARQVLDEVSKRVSERFDKKPKRSNVNPVTEQSSGRPASQTRSAGPSRLSPEQRKIGQRFVDQGALKDLKEYAKQLDAIGELG